MPEPGRGLSPRDAALKRGLDLIVAAAGLLLAGWLIMLAAAVIRLETGASGLFRQARVGRHGRIFHVLKLRTMIPSTEPGTSVTAANDPRITPWGRRFRRWKLDELPQLVNVLVGDMSLVGPRPDVPGFADRLSGADRIVLDVRPGITGPATLAYRDEERLLAGVDDPERYNRDVIFPDKVRINRRYVERYRFRDDLCYLWRTLFR